MRILISFAVLLMSLPVFAEELPFDCVDPQVQIEMNFCAGRDFQQADKELNAVWKTTMASIKGNEAELPPEFQGAPDKLLAAQRLWIEFRDAHCESDAHSSIGGSIYPLLFHSCRANLTRERTKYLRTFAQEG